MELEMTTVLFLVAAAFVAGFVDSIAGGGGLITFPALLLAGVGPLAAIATNKVQAIFGAATSAVSYTRSGLVRPLDMKRDFLASAGASGAGALVASSLPEQLLETMVPIALLGIALFFGFQPKLNDEDSVPRVPPVVIGAVAIPLVGFYDGVFGPGTGSFFMVALVGLAGYGVLKATAHAKVLNFASNLGGFVVFAVTGVIHWRLGLLMAVGQIAGAMVGSRVAVANGARVIKPLIVCTCIALAIRLLV